MIRQVLNVNNKWKVVIYYNVDYNLFHIIETELYVEGVKHKTIKRIYDTMSKEKAKAVTISNNRTSIVLFNKHKTKYDYINSIAHEAEHIKQAMLYYYNVKDLGEPPAYTIGYLVSEMIKVLNKHNNEINI